jgi:MFS family permease
MTAQATVDPPSELDGSAQLTTSDLQEPLLSPEDRIQPPNPPEDDAADPSLDVLTLPSDKDIVFTLCRKRFQVNHNVFLTLVLDVLYGVSDSLWGGTVFAAYLKKLGHDRNGPVGDIEAVNGLAVLLSALPVGYLADKYGRSRVIVAGGVLFVVTAIFHAAVMQWIGVDVEDLYSDPQKSRLSMILLGVVMGLWGIGGGIVSGPCQALYADSTPAGDRSKYYQILFVCYLMASCLGPLVSILLFQTIGDEWDLKTLQTIIYVGLALEIGNAFVMMFFDDAKALDEDEPAGAGDENEEEVSLLVTDDPETLSAEVTFEDEPEVPVGTTEELDSGEDILRKRRRWIPYILFFASVIVSIGSGMTVKFFPLFFKDEVGMSPTQVQIVYVMVPLVMAMCSGLGTSLASWFGRVQTSLLLQFSGLGCLFAMVFFKDYLDSHPLVLVPVYVMRTALMNAPYPLQESILMDYVPKNERARWKSLESISQFGWCGSAALGGYLSDRWDYTFTFFLTAIIQTAGTLCFALLLPLVPKKEAELTQQQTITTVSPSENTDS